MRNVLGTNHGLNAFRTLTIVAQDPSVTRPDGRILTAKISVPAEALLPGPAGYRVSVVDYDVTANALYQSLDLESGLEAPDDPMARVRSNERLLGDPRLHAQNTYAISMRILARFELALGRRVEWGSSGHQLFISPHAFEEANAFYSREDSGLFFGYFKSAEDPDGTIYSCLAHDVVAHETTHALLDGLRQGYLDRASPEQAGFHEGFSDVVALLSVLSLPEIVSATLDRDSRGHLIDERATTRASLKDSALFGLAKQMGQELSGVRGEALRRSVGLPPNRDYANLEEFQEEHRRGELLVAAMLNSFLDIWLARIEPIGFVSDRKRDRKLVAEEGARAADHLLTIAIRAIDYCPPVDLSFSDYLSALLTIDREVVPDDRYGYRARLLKNFNAFGIGPADDADSDGTWRRWSEEMAYSRTHFDSMLRNEEEMFRFIWENRGALNLESYGKLQVRTVRPSVRIAPDGFVLRETIAEYTHWLTLSAQELRDVFKVEVPAELSDWRDVALNGGGTLIFDEYGQLKYKIAKGLIATDADRSRQAKRITRVFENGYYSQPSDRLPQLARFHDELSQLRRVSR